MKVAHKISFAGAQQFEQHTAFFELEEKDVSPEVLGGCNLAQKMFVFNVIVLLEGLLFQYCEGYFDNAEYKKRKARIFGLLSPKLEKIVKDILSDKEKKSGDTSKKSK